MRALVFSLLAAAGFAGAAAANVVTGFYSSFYVLGDSLSDDDMNGFLWYLTTGGSPYSGNLRDGGTFTDGEVWNDPLQRKFRDAGKDADNFAVGKAQSSGGNWLIPDLDGQIDRLLDDTSPSDRGRDPLVSILIGGNNVIDAVRDGNAIETAVAAAKVVAQGVKRLARSGFDEFLVFNLPDLGKIPEYRLFEPDRRDEARAAGKAYNDELAGRIGSLERHGLNIVDIDLFSLFRRVINDPRAYGFSNVKFPCVFPSKAEADKYGRAERCSPSDAESLLFMDGVHPTARAHGIVGDVVADALKAEVRSRVAPRATQAASLAVYPASAAPVALPVPLPGSLLFLLAAVAAVVALVAGRRLATMAA